MLASGLSTGFAGVGWVVVGGVTFPDDVPVGSGVSVTTFFFDAHAAVIIIKLNANDLIINDFFFIFLLL